MYFKLFLAIFLILFFDLSFHDSYVRNQALFSWHDYKLSNEYIPTVTKTYRNGKINTIANDDTREVSIDEYIVGQSNIDTATANNPVSNSQNTKGFKYTVNEPKSKFTHADDYLNIKALGAIGDGQSHYVTQKDLSTYSHFWKGKYVEGDEWDYVALQEAILTSRSGQSIFLPKGVYLINTLRLKSNITMIGADATIKSSLSSQLLIKFVSGNSNNLVHLTFDSIDFIDIGFELVATKKFTINNVVFKNCVFEDTTNIGNKTYYIQLSHLENVLIENCKFKRNFINNSNWGVRLYKDHYVTIQNSEFWGYFKTAINVFGSFKDKKGQYPINSRNKNIIIKNNKIERINGYSVLKNKSIEVNYAEDHGIYVWGVAGIVIIGNSISGWSPTASGGSVKIRNGEDITIQNNTFNDSGIMAYTYEGTNQCNTNSNVVNASCPPAYLKNVDIKGNIIVLTTNESDRCQGIVYWRNFGRKSDIHEENILIYQNKLYGGCIRIENAYSPAFKVYENTVNDCIYTVDGVESHNNREIF